MVAHTANRDYEPTVFVTLAKMCFDPIRCYGVTAECELRLGLSGFPREFSAGSIVSGGDLELNLGGGWLIILLVEVLKEGYVAAKSGAASGGEGGGRGGRAGWDIVSCALLRDRRGGCFAFGFALIALLADMA